MKMVFSAAAWLVFGALIGLQKGRVYMTPLSKYSSKWDNAKYMKCNTGANVTYMTDDEKAVLWILNMARMDPQLFRTSVLSQAKQINAGIDTGNAEYFKSLDSTMLTMAPRPLMMPDSTVTSSARCHAETSGKTGYAGHVRQTPECREIHCTCAECCAYGFSDPLQTVLQLLVDYGEPSLGHRHTCFGTYDKIGVAMSPHSYYRFTTVIDFHW